ILTARSPSAGTRSLTGSLTTNVPAEIVIVGEPLNRRTRFVASTIAAPPALTATRAAPRTTSSPPYAFDRRMRPPSTPMHVRTICRSVWPLIGRGEDAGCGLAVHVPTQPRPSSGSVSTAAGRTRRTAAVNEIAARVIERLDNEPIASPFKYTQAGRDAVR